MLTNFGEPTRTGISKIVPRASFKIFFSLSNPLLDIDGVVRKVEDSNQSGFLLPSEKWQHTVSQKMFTSTRLQPLGVCGAIANEI